MRMSSGMWVVSVQVCVRVSETPPVTIRHRSFDDVTWFYLCNLLYLHVFGERSEVAPNIGNHKGTERTGRPILCSQTQHCPYPTSLAYPIP